MGSDRYCLRWNNHQNNLLGVFSQLLQEESLVDVTLACSEGHSIRAHKVVLSACSSYFQSLFLDHPNRHPIIILKDVCFAELRTLVEFMYRGEVNLEYCQLPTFLKTAESLQVKGLAEMTHLRSSLSPDQDIPPSGDGQALQDELSSTVIATTATVTAHEPLPLIRRRSRSPTEAEVSERIPTDTPARLPLQLSPRTAPSVSSPRSNAAAFESSQTRSPPSRMPMSVSPHLADTSSVCEDQRSISPDMDDDVSSIQSGPNDLTVTVKLIPSSNYPPVQDTPLVSISLFFLFA